MRTTRNDLTNQVFGNLTVIGPRRSIPYGKPSRKTGHQRFVSEWFCRCQCGNEVWRRADSLIQGTSDSCGCLQKQRTLAKIHLAHAAAAIANRTHGMCASKPRKTKMNPTYVSYHSMLKRCHNPNDISWPHYGAKGIAVCERWKESFENFLQDMGPRPGRTYSLDRKDTSQNYSPENCRWALRADENRNKKKTIRTPDGHCLSAMCRHYRVDYFQVHYYLRYYKGATFREAVKWARAKKAREERLKNSNPSEQTFDFDSPSSNNM